MLWLLLGVTSAMLTLNGAGWLAAGSVLRQGVTFHAPQIQSAIVIGLALLVLRAAAAASSCSACSPSPPWRS